MKKTIIAAIMIALLLCGCLDRIPLSQANNNISKIELINQKEEPSLCTLTGEEALRFMDELMQLDCYKNLNPVGEIGYLQVHIYYQNGDVDYIGCRANGWLRAGENTLSGWHYYKEPDLLELIRSYWK